MKQQSLGKEPGRSLVADPFPLLIITACFLLAGCSDEQTFYQAGECYWTSSECKGVSEEQAFADRVVDKWAEEYTHKSNTRRVRPL